MLNIQKFVGQNGMIPLTLKINSKIINPKSRVWIYTIIIIVIVIIIVILLLYYYRIIIVSIFLT